MGPAVSKICGRREPLRLLGGSAPRQEPQRDGTGGLGDASIENHLVLVEFGATHWLVQVHEDQGSILAATVR
jgi:hypothetical protein